MAIDVGKVEGRVALNPPNVLSYVRVAFGILAFLLVEERVLFATMVAAGVLTDWLDGFLARRTGSRSRLGGLVDPVCDKLFVFLILLALFVRVQDPIPGWELLLVLSRDLVSAGMLVYSILERSGRPIEFSAHTLGKLVTVLQYLYLALRVLGLPGGPALAIAVGALTPPATLLYARRHFRGGSAGRTPP